MGKLKITDITSSILPEVYQLALDISGSGVYTWDVTTNQVVWNARTYAIFGLPEATPIDYAKYMQCLHPEDVERLQNAVQVALTGGPFFIEHRILWPSGEVRYVQCKGHMKFDEGQPQFFTGVVRDCTEETRIRKDLEISEERLRLAYTGASDGIWDWNMETQDVYFSQRWKTMLGYKVHEVENSFEGFQSLLHPEDHERVQDAIRDTIEDPNIPYHIEFRMKHKQGHYVSILSRGFLIFREAKAVRMVGTHVDLTELKSKEAELQEKKHHLSAIVTSLDDIVFLIDKNLYFREIWTSNEADLFEPKDVLLNAPIAEVLPAPLGQKLSDVCQTVFENQRNTCIEYPSPDGTQWFRANIRPIRTSDAFLVVIVQNVTLQKAGEKRLREAVQAAEQASQAKSNFLANMSHELRTPLNPIMGLSQQLQNRLPAGSKERIFAERVFQNSQRLLNLIGNILDLSKLEAGHVHLIYEPTDLFVLLAQIQNLLEAQIKLKNNTFSCLNHLVQSSFWLDSHKLKQILVNLLENANKFTSNGAIILTVTTEENWLVFKVSDTGIGIDQDFLPHVFESFTQENVSKSREFQGSGLGLATCQNITRSMGGKLSVSSALGQGATFTLKLPVHNHKPV